MWWTLSVFTTRGGEDSFMGKTYLVGIFKYNCVYYSVDRLFCEVQNGEYAFILVSRISYSMVLRLVLKRSTHLTAVYAAKRTSEV